MKTQRLFLVDIIKVCFLSLIILYDGYAALWSEETAWPLGKGFLWDLVYNTLHSFCFAGFVVLAAFAFLVGYRRGRIQMRNLIFLVIIGCLLLSLSEGGLRISSLWVEWDIYHYLLVNIVAIYLCTKSETLSWILAVLGLGLFFIPWQDWGAAHGLSIEAQRVLTGHCDGNGRGGWHLLPWMGLSWVMYAYGRITATHPFKGKFELALWTPALIFSVFNWGAYSYPPLALGFYCFVFSRSAADFWIQMLPVIFLFRLATDDKVQWYFEHYPRLRFCSRLFLAKKLGLAFIIHIFVTDLFGEFAVEIRSRPLLLEGYFIVLLPLVEVLTRGGDRLLRKLTSPGNQG